MHIQEQRLHRDPYFPCRWTASVQMTEPEVQIYGNGAILTYKETVSGDEGQPSNYTGKVTMIYVNEGGRWSGVYYYESKNKAKN